MYIQPETNTIYIQNEPIILENNIQHFIIDYNKIKQVILQYFILFILIIPFFCAELLVLDNEKCIDKKIDYIINMKIYLYGSLLLYSFIFIILFPLNILYYYNCTFQKIYIYHNLLYCTFFSSWTFIGNIIFLCYFSLKYCSDFNVNYLLLSFVLKDIIMFMCIIKLYFIVF